MTAAGIQTVKAGDREWAIAGKVLTGLAIASVVTHAVEAGPACYPARCDARVIFSYDYCPPPAPRVVYVPPPPPVVVYRAPAYVVPVPVCVRPAPVVIYREALGDRHHHRQRGRR